MLTFQSVTPRMHTVPNDTSNDKLDGTKAETNRSIAQPGSAPGLGPGGRRFESYCSDQFFKAKFFRDSFIIGNALVAQLDRASAF